MYTCVYVCTYTYIYIYIYTHTHIVYIYIYIYIYLYVRLRSSVCSSEGGYISRVRTLGMPSGQLLHGFVVSANLRNTPQYFLVIAFGQNKSPQASAMLGKTSAKTAQTNVSLPCGRLSCGDYLFKVLRLHILSNIGRNSGECLFRFWKGVLTQRRLLATATYHLIMHRQLNGKSHSIYLV